MTERELLDAFCAELAAAGIAHEREVPCSIAAHPHRADIVVRRSGERRAVAVVEAKVHPRRFIAGVGQLVVYASALRGDPVPIMVVPAGCADWRTVGLVRAAGIAVWEFDPADPTLPDVLVDPVAVPA